jgi:hypothetical protein
MAGHDAVELAERLSLPHRQEGLDPAPGADRLHGDVVASIDHGHAEAQLRRPGVA